MVYSTNECVFYEHGTERIMSMYCYYDNDICFAGDEPVFIFFFQLPQPKSNFHILISATNMQLKRQRVEFFIDKKNETDYYEAYFCMLFNQFLAYWFEFYMIHESNILHNGKSFLFFLFRRTALKYSLIADEMRFALQNRAHLANESWNFRNLLLIPFGINLRIKMKFSSRNRRYAIKRTCSIP